MINICTVSDYNYLKKGLSLYESLLSKTEDFILHYLCIDDKTFNLLESYKSDTLKVYNINEILNKDRKLSNLKNKKYKWAGVRSAEYFFYALASYFTNYLMNILNESITYIDSDVYFHQSFQHILNEIDNRDVGVFRHRQTDMFADKPEGMFNVGVVYFKNSDIGKSTLNWWSDAVLLRKYPKLATCGDQRYLDAFLDMCPENSIMVDSITIGHGAPWQWQLYDFSDYEKDGSIIWETKKQKLIFTHFARFKDDSDGYNPCTFTPHYDLTPLSMYSEISGLKKIYDDYYSITKEVKNKYNI